jgi:hypothetical protein
VGLLGTLKAFFPLLSAVFIMTKFPFVPGHEVVGTIAALGDRSFPVRTFGLRKAIRDERSLRFTQQFTG